MKKQQMRAFTLVELIIVITILAILATIGFMSYQSYTTDARDGKRKADLGELRNGLELYQAKNTTLPDPDAQTVTIMSGANTISVQGYLGANVLSKLRATSDIKDPNDNSYYTYSVNGTKTKYQLLGMLESQNNLAMNNNILNQTYARTDYTSRFAYTTGNKVGIFFSGTTNTPLQETTNGNLVLTDATNSTKIFKVMFSNSTTNSGTIALSGASLPAQIQTITNSVAIQILYNPTVSCSSTIPSNASTTIGNPTTLNQAWQNTNTGNPCYYACTGGYTGSDCSIPPVYVSTNSYNTYLIGQKFSYNTAIITVTNLGIGFSNTKENPNCDYDIAVWSGTTIQIRSACNLGTNISGTGIDSYGSYYQWGKMVSGWTSGWITNNWGTGGLLQGPCNNGYKVPTSSEFSSLYNIYGNSLASVGIKLKLPYSGQISSIGTLAGTGTNSSYWTSEGNNSSFSGQAVVMDMANAGWGAGYIQYVMGYPIRCKKI